MVRVAKRTKRRLTCRLGVGGRFVSGVILDLSSTGLFVQTHAKPALRERLVVEISVPGHARQLRLGAVVARVRLVPPQLLNVAQGGVGLRITSAPEEYFAFLGALMPEPGEASPAVACGLLELEPATEEAAGEAKPEPSAVAAFRVRVSQTGGARTRTLRVIGASASEAVALALAEVGEGWRVLEATPDDEPAGGG
jgi:hypothetical protein